MEKSRIVNGIPMPLVGLGTMRVFGDECTEYIRDAIKTGYRLIDTAHEYKNEEAIAEGIRLSGVDRTDLMLTTKIWITESGYERAKVSMDESMKNLRTDYLDVVLIHCCSGDYYGTYRAMQEYYKAGKVKIIGVCNFSSERLADLCLFSEISPMVNQVETNIFFQNKKLREVMKRYNVHHEAWGPLAQERVGEIISNETLNLIGIKYKKTAPQIALKFLVQSGITIIPKADSKKILEDNIDLYDFELDDRDMQALCKMDEGFSMKSDYGNPLSAEYAYSEYVNDPIKMFN